MGWQNALGWAGSALLVYSLLQARVLRFRVLNLVASLVLVVFNALISVWPMVAMNLVLAGINVWFIRKLLTERHDETAYQVLEVGLDDAYLRHVLAVHAEDLRRFFPDHVDLVDDGHRSAYLVEHGDETVGVVVVRDVGEGVAQVELDYATLRYRDFTPGEFVFRRSRLFTDRGFRRVVSPPKVVAPYYQRLGFRPEGESFVLDLEAE
jgi:hypothetical protein